VVSAYSPCCAQNCATEGCGLVSPLIYVTAFDSLPPAATNRDTLLCPAPVLDVERIPLSALSPLCLLQSTSPNAHACVLHPDLLQPCDGPCTIGSLFEIICNQCQPIPGPSIALSISSCLAYPDNHPQTTRFVTPDLPGPTPMGVTPASTPCSPTYVHG
jgi:hypothetical protein